MPKKKAADVETPRSELNRFGVKCWRGEDVKNLREEFDLSHDEMASLLGLNNRSQSSRYEAQEQIAPLASLAFELVKNLLYAERAESSGDSIARGDAAAASTFAERGDKVESNTSFTADSFRLELNNTSRKKAKLTVRLDFADGIKLTVEETIKNSSKVLKEVTLL